MTPSRARHGERLKLHRSSVFGEVSNAPLSAKNRTKPPITDNGTSFAIKYITSGVAAHLPCSTNRGGAHNRADRESHALTAAQVGNLKAAQRHAEKLGLPFTRMITIHWEAAGVPLATMAKATGRFIDLMTKALARHGCKTAWLWVHENCGPKGGHCHLLAHVPVHCISILTGLQKGWLRRITGQPYRKRVIHSTPIGGRLGLEQGNPDLHAINLEAALAYLLKGARPDAASRFDLERRKAGGRVIGKRCGTSQNIGAKARKTES